MAIKYHFCLDEDERAMLKNLIKQEKPRVAQHKKRNAQILCSFKNKWEIVYICPPYSSLLNSSENIHGRPFSDSSRHHLSLVSWYIESLNFDTEKSRLDFYINFRRGATFRDNNENDPSRRLSENSLI